MRRAVTCLLVCALAFTGLPQARADEDLTRYVDPFIGTFGSGFVFPGPAAPYGMVQLSPDTEGYFAYMGYLWSDTHIRGFSHVHIESMGVHMGGNVPFMPTTGPVLSTDPLRYMSRFDHANEDASPGYYRVLLQDYAIEAELTAGLRVGMHRYSFPPGLQGNVLMDVGRSVPKNGDELRPGAHRAAVEILDDRNVSGTAFTRNGYAVHFHTRFDRPMDSFGTWDAPAADPVPGRAQVDAEGAGAVASFDDPGEVVAKTGVSFVSRENALENLEAELPGDDFGFDALRERTRAEWDDALHSVVVEGGSEAEKISFYTALYHAQHHPNVFTDVDGSYMGHDGQPHAADGYIHYANFSLWDTYRGQMQLVATIAPDRYRDMLRSMLHIHEQQGRLPRWALQNVSPDYMMGDPAAISIADGVCRGITDPTLERDLFEAMRHAVLDAPRDPALLEHGYIPHDVTSRGASATLEHALAAHSLALVADRVGEAETRDEALAIADSWRNLVGPQRWIQPRMSDGSWREPYHPEMPDGYQEGTGWQWSWMVPHDVDALVDAMGGEQVVRDRLDTHFSALLAEPVPGVVPEVQKHITVFGIAYYGNQYAPSNEHELHAPYLYDWVGEPSKTQAIVRGLQQLYRPTPDGIPGNDDLGSMSSWFVWSALGFYPAVGGVPGFAIGSPMFERAEVRLPDGTFTVRAPGASIASKYIAAAALDGETFEETWLPAEAVSGGGELSFEMSPIAARWGADAPPPSQSADGLQAFGCG